MQLKHVIPYIFSVNVTKTTNFIIFNQYMYTMLTAKEKAEKWDRNRKIGAIDAYKKGRVSKNWIKGVLGYVLEKN